MNKNLLLIIVLGIVFIGPTLMVMTMVGDVYVRGQNSENNGEWHHIRREITLSDFFGIIFIELLVIATILFSAFAEYEQRPKYGK